MKLHECPLWPNEIEEEIPDNIVVSCPCRRMFTVEQVRDWLKNLGYVGLAEQPEYGLAAWAERQEAKR